METLQEKYYTPNEYDQNIRDRHDIETWLAEVLDGQMLTEFSYDYDPATKELYAEDGSGLRKIFEDSIDDAQNKAWQNPLLSFEVRRRKKELDEYEDMIEMMNGGPNTMIVVSDFPQELAGNSEDIGGYNTTRNQTMLRIITRDDGGKVRVRSQSLDGSNRQALEAIYDYMKEDVEDGELLGQRIKTNLDSHSQEFLVDSLKGTYDRSLSKQYGGEWSAGRPKSLGFINTHDFVFSQSDLIDYFVKNKNVPGVDEGNLTFAVASEMERRWNNQLKRETPSFIESVNIDPTMLEHYIQQSYTQAKAEGKSYSGCGATVKSADKQLKELGYGNQSTESAKDDEETESDHLGPLQFKCKNGHDNRRPRGKLIDCKVKGCKGASC